MKQVKQSETEKLLALIFQAGAQVEAKSTDGQPVLLIGPPEIARRFGDQIRQLKSQILKALGHCPKCGRELNIKIEESSTGKSGRHSYCSGDTPWHFDRWEF